MTFYASGTLVRHGKEFPFLLTDVAGDFDNQPFHAFTRATK